MEDYDIEFNKLARFASKYVSTEKMRINRFIVGLTDEIQGFVVAHDPLDYASALKFAILMDMHRLKGKSSATASSVPTTMAIELTDELVDVLIIADRPWIRIRHRAPNATGFMKERVMPFVDVIGVTSQATKLLTVPTEIHLR